VDWTEILVGAIDDIWIEEEGQQRTSVLSGVVANTPGPQSWIELDRVCRTGGFG
jgi:hypothetical protein